MLREKSTWVALLRALCYQRSIFFPSYRIDEMSIERHRRACRSPFLFAQLLESNSSLSSDQPVLEPSSKAYLYLGEPRVFYDTAFLVPGGRFLVQSHRGHLGVWDLGPPDTPALAESILLCQSPTKPHASTREMCDDRLAVRMVGEDTLRVAVASGYTTFVVSFHFHCRPLR
jgi:hypothetical protein